MERPQDRLQEGQEFVERITVKNQSWFSKLWLEVDDPSDMPGHIAGTQSSRLGRENRGRGEPTLTASCGACSASGR